MVKRTLMLVFAISCSLFSGPPVQGSPIVCYQGDSIYNKDGTYVGCAINDCGGCEYCEVVAQMP
jgi:hypothetical protein